MACSTHAGSKCSRLRDPHHRKIQTLHDSSRTSERTVSVVQTGEPAILKDQLSQPTHWEASSALRDAMLGHLRSRNRGKERGRKGVRDAVRRNYDNGETDQKVPQQLGDCGRKQKRTTPGDHPVDNRQTCLPAFRKARSRTWV